MDEKEIGDDRTPNNLAQPLCPDCSYPLPECDCADMEKIEKILDKP